MRWPLLPHGSPRDPIPVTFASSLCTTIGVFVMLLAPSLAPLHADGAVQVFGPGTIAEEMARSATPASRAAPEGRPLMPMKTTGHVSAISVPIATLPTEDVDPVEVFVPGGFAPATVVWPTEGAVDFIDEAGAAVFATIPTVSPNITGVDFVSDGTWGAFATLGFLYIFDMAGPGPGFPSLTVPPIPLPGTPARRDIDPMLIPHPLSVSGVAVVYATGTEIHCYEIPTGAVMWSIPLPTPVVEAVDPQINGAGTLLFAPSEGFMRAINPVTGAILSTTALGTTLVREVDARFVLGDARCYLPASGALWIFDGTPPLAGGLGLPIAGAPLTLASPLIEGNDMMVNPTGAYGFLPTLAFMYQVDLAGGFFAASHLFSGAVHQRNQDAEFTPPLIAPAKAVYCTQGIMWIYDVFGFAVVPPVTVAIAGTLVDGVDPMLTDTPPFGTIATVSTLGFTHIIDVLAGAAVPGSPLVTPGVLRVDVDSKPAPVPGNRILQPTLGGLWMLSGFGPSDWVVPTSGGLYVVNLAVPFVDQFVLTGLVYRGGDAQPTTLLVGPAEAAFQVDNPDQDFLTKCWEYKFAINRWPYWWSVSQPAYYPHWVPYGVFGPPAMVGWDILNEYKVTLLGPSGPFPNQVAILTARGLLIQTIGLPAAAIGGFIWDYDNKICKLRLYGQLEAVIDLSPIVNTGFATVNFVNYGAKTRWYPVIDRMNGWEFVVYQGGRRVWIYDHLRNLPITVIDLPATCIRRPVFDEQRKVLCLTLANRRLFFINAHRLRLGLPNATYATSDLGHQVVGTPVFDLYNHHAVVKLYGSRLAVCNVDDGVVVWNSGPLPYWPISPIQIDCYNKVAKCYYRNAVSFWEMHLNLYPLVFGAAPVLQWLPLPAQPYGYPIFDSKDGYEFDVIPPNRIYYRNLFTLASNFIVTPFPIAGNLFMDRVNKYALVRLRGLLPPDPDLLWMDLFRLTQGLPGATNLIALQDAGGAPVEAQEDIVFTTQGDAMVHLQNGQVAVVDMRDGVQSHVSNGFPNLERQLYVHPFRGVVNYPHASALLSAEVTIDLTPIRSFSPPQLPTFHVQPLDPPVEASDFIPPLQPPAALISTRPHLGGDIPIEIVQLELVGVEPGVTIQATNTTRFNGFETDEPNEAQAEDDGSVRGITVAGFPGDIVCFVAFDAAGNASPPTCIPVAAPLGVPTDDGSDFAFSMTSENPVRDEVRFRFGLPRRSRVDLAIYDLAGRRVAEVVNRELEAGEHEAAWHRDAVGPISAGVYFARFRAGNYEVSRRLETS